MNHKSILKKLISIILIISILSVSPLTVIALNAASETEQGESSEGELQTNGLLAPVIIEEDTSKRTEYVKHFLCDDGSYIAVTYPEPVHEIKDGKWEDVVFSVEESGKDIKVQFENGQATLKKVLTDNAGDDSVKLVVDKYHISWSVESNIEGKAEETNVQVKTNEQIRNQNKNSITGKSEDVVKEKNELKNKLSKGNKSYEQIKTDYDVFVFNEKTNEHNREIIKSTTTAQANIMYEGGLGDGVSLRYIVTPDGINEDVIIDKPCGFTSYTMNMKIPKLTPRLEDNNSVSLLDKDNNIVLTIDSPYMYDNENGYSRDISVSITQKGSNCSITYTPNAQWLNSSDRVYPIVIDPMINTQTTSISYDDYYTRDGITYNTTELYVGYTPGTTENISYWGYDDYILNIPGTTTLTGETVPATITGCTFNAKFTDGTTTMGTIGLYDSMGNLLSTVSNLNSTGWATFYSSPLSNYINTNQNNSVACAYFTLKYTQYTDDYNVFYSSEFRRNGTLSDIPYLEVRYTLEFEDITQGKYLIKNASTGKYLSVYNNSPDEMAAVVQRSLAYESGQIWQLAMNGSSTSYNLIPDCCFFKTLFWGNQQRAQMRNYLNLEWGQWQFERQADGTYYISSKAEPWMVLDVNNSSTDENAEVLIFPNKQTLNQRWILEPIPQIILNSNYFSMEVGDQDALSYRSINVPSGEPIYWSSSNESILSIDENTGEMTALKDGEVIVTVFFEQDNTFGDSCTVDVDKKLIYRTRNREEYGFANSNDDTDITPIQKEDLQYGQKDTGTIISNGTHISLSDLNDYNFQERVLIIKNFFNSQINYDPTFMNILGDMVDHFTSGTGTYYSNSALTNAVETHETTMNYTNDVVYLLNSYISNNSGDISDLSYDEDLWVQPAARRDHPMVCAMIDSDYAHKLPNYGINNGVAGLTLALNGLEGNKLEIVEYNQNENSYSGVLEFTFYDHFGLDTSDLATGKYGNVDTGLLIGFRQWYILQHWSELNASVQPKPYVTIISYRVNFSGTLED